MHSDLQKLAKQKNTSVRVILQKIAKDILTNQKDQHKTN
ncbi:MAG: hypothetical protein UT19_C0012G0028 [Candidatus Woesebacteria bacterium GW2011_GWB1_39_10b]|uniref:Uncharacterized protein n=1 Tax=Candidatus Woesebacteria bacterium GW2011_GWB1_39_10b TaxID=1618573 RepID=A0A0G0P5M8_9BACT|nr:MAG: hypothetical protein US72_C0013G0009 [Microgenomates group bacterium GW2011_GWC1_38_12]KKQ93439.1 MAG: hypothetical protein UT19_C0012G0028 [Candidatus Woesebacteria bacterium GW2011_GWB1_39_10b]